jgi:hypothetical protein
VSALVITGCVLVMTGGVLALGTVVGDAVGASEAGGVEGVAPSGVGAVETPPPTSPAAAGLSEPV